VLKRLFTKEVEASSWPNPSPGAATEREVSQSPVTHTYGILTTKSFICNTHIYVHTIGNCGGGAGGDVGGYARFGCGIPYDCIETPACCSSCYKLDASNY
jgi:hypothetical protein